VCVCVSGGIIIIIIIMYGDGKGVFGGAGG